MLGRLFSILYKQWEWKNETEILSVSIGRFSSAGGVANAAVGFQ